MTPEQKKHILANQATPTKQLSRQTGIKQKDIIQFLQQERFRKDAAEKSPNKARPLENLAVSYLEAGENEKSIEYGKKALAIQEQG